MPLSFPSRAIAYPQSIDSHTTKSNFSLNMSAFDECCVLIPAATLEDFPSDLSDCDARSLLAAWTVLWHPRLLADQEQIPTWYRADSPPEPVGRRIFAVPTPSLAQLPERYASQCQRAEGCRWVTGADRQEMLDALSLGESLSDVQGERRSICVDDFFAVGFAVLQIQVMTRRLRYTSNLDEIHLQNRVVASAKAFLEQDGNAAVEAMHDVFDCLAEERDHYFSSDPHLIDLTLMTETTVEALLEFGHFGQAEPSKKEPIVGEPNASEPSASEPSASEPGRQAGDDGANDTAPAVLPTPMNVLIDHGVAEAISKLAPDRTAPLRAALVEGTLGWAGGGPAKEHCLDEMTFNEAESAFKNTHRLTAQAIGKPPSIYARFSGSTPSDLTAALVRLGYQGLIPLDFSAGTGYGDEAKVILRAAGTEIETLTAKPMDATSDAAFLPLGSKLGESIDSGEIATALLAHWPGQSCDSYHDLRRVASWSLALGRFWKLDDYFREGERPYHHGTAQAASPGAAERLGSRVDQATVDPIASAAASFRDSVIRDQQSKLEGLAGLVSDASQEPAVDRLAKAVGCPSVDVPPRSEKGGAILLVNPHSIGCRNTTEIEGTVSDASDHIYGVSVEGGSSVVTADVPACGFAMIQASARPRSRGFSIGKLLGLGGPKTIAEEFRLQNEFMEVSISPNSGGISGVYSGGARGNRFSMRLVRSGNSSKSAAAETTMRAGTSRVAASTSELGQIDSEGEILDSAGDSIARFKLTYTLRRGSRMLSVSGELTPLAALRGEPWKNYLAARVAVVSDASIFRLLLRDKVHRARGRRLVAPLGVVLDEAERQTMVSCDGLPYHAKVGDRFLDTLLAVQGETDVRFTLNYGFDVTSPVAAANALIAPPVQVPVTPSDKATAIGWLVHTSPKDIVLTRLDVQRRRDGRLAAVVRVVQTRSKSCTATLRFIHAVDHAVVLEPFADDAIELAVSELAESSVLKSKDDQVSLPMVGHQVVDVLVVFHADSKR